MRHFLILQLCTIIINGEITETVVNYKVICLKMKQVDLVVTLVCLSVETSHFYSYMLLICWGLT